MNIEDRLRRAADSINAELESVPVPEPPKRHRRGWVRLVVAAVFALVVVGSILWVVDGRGTLPAASEGSSTSTTKPTLEEEAPEREPPTPQPSGPTVVIAEGTVEGSEETWRLSAFISTEGNLCMNLNGGLGCGPIPNAAVPLSSPSTSVRDVPGSRLSCVSGGLSQQASAVVLTFTDGTVFRPTIHSGGELPANFYAHCWGGELDLAILEVFDMDGETLAVSGQAGDQETVSGGAPEGSVFGVWELIELDGESPIRQLSVTFSLEPELPTDADTAIRSGYYRFQGQDGCNSFSGVYSISGDRITTTPGVTSLISCPAGEVNDQAKRFTSLLNQGGQWARDSGQLVLTGDSGAVARLQKIDTNGAMGVWNLIEFDGRPLGASVTLTFSRPSRFSGYVGCWISGDYEITGNQLSVSALPPEVGPEDREGVPPQFLCETLNEQEQQFLELIEAGQGVIQSDELTITNEAGATASFQRQ